jgi:hypothetical protein
MLEHTRRLIVSGCCSRSYKPCQHHLLMKTVRQTKSLIALLYKTCHFIWIFVWRRIYFSRDQQRQYIHAWITYSYSCLSSECMLYTDLLYHSTKFDTQIVPLLCLFQDLALNNMSFHFGDICVTTQLLQQRPTASIAFIWESHYIREHSYVCLSECMLYTHLSYHSSMFDAHSFHLYFCMSIYLPVVLRSCYTTTMLKVRCTLCLTLLLRHLACRRRPRLHVRLHPAADNGDAPT